MIEIASGRLAKMHVEQGDLVSYRLDLGGESIALSKYLGKRLKLVHHEQIKCCHCQRVTKKSFSQGYCYPCFQKLARCDRCIMSPELCHYSAGTCREPEWGEQFCMQPHIVYLANSSGIKVGITRQTQVPTRWIDQGAIQALPIVSVSSRLLSGLVEDHFRQWLPDRTNWRKMLKHDVEVMDLVAERDRLSALAKDGLTTLREQYPNERIDWLVEGKQWAFEYPSLKWPEKAKTYNLDKTPEIEDTLIAIKGQYLIFESACLNIRKYTSYEVSLFAEAKL